jgi:uncharacterized protein
VSCAADWRRTWLAGGADSNVRFSKVSGAVWLSLLLALLLGTTPALADNPPQLAILIDDLGYNLPLGRQALALPGPITVAVIPFTPHARTLSAEAEQAGIEVMLHQPMEGSVGRPASRGELTLDMDEASFRAALRNALAEVPQAAGLNNHQGSRLTAHAEPMQWLMEELRDLSLYFVDSRTTAESVALEQAQAHEIPALPRDLFLDHVPQRQVIEQQFQRALSRARQQGHALLIAHPYPESLRFLAEALPELPAYGIEVVSLGDLIAAQTAIGNGRRPLMAGAPGAETPYPSENALSGGRDATAAGIGGQRHAQRPAESLENGLGLVMRVHTPQIVDMQRHLRMIDETLKEFPQQVYIKAAD